MPNLAIKPNSDQKRESLLLKLEQRIVRKKLRVSKKDSKYNVANKAITPEEYQLLYRAAEKSGRNAYRNALMIYMTYRHGLRVSEVCDMTWSQIDFNSRSIRVERLKKSRDTVQPLDRKELVGLGKLKTKAIKSNFQNPFIFLSHHQTPMHRQTFFELFKDLVKKAGLRTTLSPHSLRHGCGFRLTNEGRTTRDIQDYLGHVCIANTVIYTALANDRFKDF